MEIAIIVGLGNPGRRYTQTWHNLGWMVVEELGRRWRVNFHQGKGPYLEAKGREVTLLLPTLYMNRSGEAVSFYLGYHKLSPSRMLVVYDDYDLPLGEIRIRKEGSSGGHRGMEDIISRLKTSQIPRIRLGIRTEEEVEDLAQYVLSPIPGIWREQVRVMVNVAAEAIETILDRGIEQAMNLYHGKNWLREG